MMVLLAFRAEKPSPLSLPPVFAVFFADPRELAVDSRRGQASDGSRVPRRRIRRLLMSVSRLLIRGLLVSTGLNALSAQPFDPLPLYQHIFIIIEENHGYRQIIGNLNAPNLNRLAGTYGLARQFFGVVHPSEANYIAMIGG